MKVLHVVPALFGKDDGITGGAERYVYELARHMADIVPTSLVTFGEHDRELTEGSLHVRVIGRPWHVRGQRANPFALALLDDVWRADVVHCHQQHIVASTVSALAARLVGRRVFCTDLGGGGWDLSAYVSTDSFYTAHLHISEYSRAVAGHSGKPWAHVILGGVDTAKFSPGPASRHDGGVLFVGRLLPHKGVDVLLRALPSDMPAEIVGPICDARYLADLRTLAAGKRVTFRHDCDDATLVEAYRACMCIVLPSVYDDMYGGHTNVPELLGQTLLEGMACGSPGVCTQVASLPEIVDAGITGCVVPPNDPAALENALTHLAGNRDRAQQMGGAAREAMTARFTWAAVVDKCLAAYRATDKAFRTAASF